MFRMADFAAIVKELDERFTGLVFSRNKGWIAAST
jgi:hypothetical protein